jgi:hypothetical protein
VADAGGLVGSDVWVKITVVQRTSAQAVIIKKPIDGAECFKDKKKRGGIVPPVIIYVIFAELPFSFAADRKVCPAAAPCIRTWY